MDQIKTLKFHVSGMHCKSCEIMTESDLMDLPNIQKAKSSLKHQSIEVTGDFGDKDPEVIAQELTEVLKPRGYALSLEKTKKRANWKEFQIAAPIAIAFIILFVFLQKTGFINLLDTSKISLGTSFLIGVVASLSTCMAVVGGVLLSMSATFAKEGDKVKPQILFHIGRLVSFFVLGGVIGFVGSAFTLNTTATFALNFLIGLIMLVLGINLLDTFHFAKKIQPAMPKFVSKNVLSVSKLNHSLTPLLVGIATFFLPCGFTQAMQIYTLSTGNFLNGAVTMFVFALGTLPVLALISFSSLKINPKSSGIFFKTVGLIVILFAILNIINGLVVAGLVPQFLNI